jgi:hypothetical protein
MWRNGNKPVFMKSLKPNFINLLHGILICSLLITGACKKDKKETDPTKALLGTWVDSDQPSYRTQLSFNGSGQYTYTLLLRDNGKISSTSYSGNYTIKADSLKIDIHEKIEQDQNAQIVKTPDNTNFFEKATFTIKDNILSIKYISYPTDGPSLAERKFHRPATD